MVTVEKKNKLIIIIEDEPEQRLALKQFLITEGYDVLDYSSAEDALHNLQTLKPHLIVSDIKLPGIDGITFFHEIRKINNLRDVPFFFISAFNDPDTIASIRSLGMVDYITKPYELDEFLEIVKKSFSSGEIN